MKERVDRKDNSNQTEATPECLRDGIFESMIEKGLYPEYWDGGDHITVVMPPKNAQPGDDREFQCGGQIQFISANGDLRGFAIQHDVSLQEALELKARQAAVLEEMGLPTS